MNGSFRINSFFFEKGGVEGEGRWEMGEGGGTLLSTSVLLIHHSS